MAHSNQLPKLSSSSKFLGKRDVQVAKDVLYPPPQGESAQGESEIM
jgi:hypothetical protein